MDVIGYRHDRLNTKYGHNQQHHGHQHDHAKLEALNKIFEDDDDSEEEGETWIFVHSIGIVIFIAFATLVVVAVTLYGLIKRCRNRRSQYLLLEEQPQLGDDPQQAPRRNDEARSNEPPQKRQKSPSTSRKSPAKPKTTSVQQNKTQFQSIEQSVPTKSAVRQEEPTMSQKTSWRKNETVWQKTELRQNEETVWEKPVARKKQLPKPTKSVLWLNGKPARSKSPVPLQKDPIAVHGDKNTEMSLDMLIEVVRFSEDDFYAKQFESLPEGLLKSHNVALENAKKNRYAHIIPYDDCRVKVTGCSTDYINASYIDGFNRKKQAYIAAQGPMKVDSTKKDFGVFWKMVWQQDVEIILMLTNLMVDDKPECDQYWPNLYCQQSSGDMLIEADTETQFANYTLRSFKVKTTGTKPRYRCVKQLHFTGWPDHDVPDDVVGLLEFRHKAGSLPQSLNGPVLVHCSSGVGRTGVYIALDILAQQDQTKETTIDIIQLVRRLRECRVNMVQTCVQLQFLYQLVAHVLVDEYKPVLKADFKQEMERLKGSESLDKLYDKLVESLERPLSEEAEAIKGNEMWQDRNRLDADVPGIHHRVLIYEHDWEVYVNAVYIDSHTVKKRYISAQSPLPNTVEDFLSMIYTERCSCVVGFEAPDRTPAIRKDDDIGAYYPLDNSSGEYGRFSVTHGNGVITRNSIKSQLSITKDGVGALSVPHRQFTQWNEETGLPRSTSNFLKFIRDAQQGAHGSGNDGPILVHCRNGADKSGLFCAVAVLVEKLRTENDISIPNTVKQIMSRRRKAVPTHEQFLFCFGGVMEYLKRSDQY